MKIQESAEDYLEAILILKNERGLVHSIDVARHLDFSKPSVSRAVKLLREQGHVTMSADGALELTEAALGFDQAWTGDGPDGSCLLLRQGTTVAVLEAPAELTGADTLEKLWTRLQLEGKAA